jgi:hypothetical protein
VAASLAVARAAEALVTVLVALRTEAPANVPVVALGGRVLANAQADPNTVGLVSVRVAQAAQAPVNARAVPRAAIPQITRSARDAMHDVASAKATRCSILRAQPA